MFTEFNIITGNQVSKDFYEKTADLLLKPLRLSCGRFVKIHQELQYVQQKTVNKICKVIFFAFFVAAFPVTLLMTFPGIVLAKCSDSYAKLNQLYSKLEYVIPERRYPPLSMLDTVVIGRNGKMASEHGQALCFKNEDILKIHPVKYLSNPFSRDNKFFSEEGSLPEKLVDQALGVTQSGKHVILQQAKRSCVPTAMAMLILDRGGAPDFKAVEETNLANCEKEGLDWMNKAGFKPKITSLNQKNVAKQLVSLLKSHGPGVLSISGPDIGSHVIILDAISLENKTADIRDPLHGWAVTVKLDALLALHRSSLCLEGFISEENSIPEENFIQIDWSLLPSFVIKSQFLFRKIVIENR